LVCQNESGNDVFAQKSYHSETVPRYRPISNQHQYGI
jgi:hypothetical protein